MPPAKIFFTIGAKDAHKIVPLNFKHLIFHSLTEHQCDELVPPNSSATCNVVSIKIYNTAGWDSPPFVANAAKEKRIDL
jgi:hypothetical protein